MLLNCMCEMLKIVTVGYVDFTIVILAFEKIDKELAWKWL